MTNLDSARPTHKMFRIVIKLRIALINKNIEAINNYR